MLLLLTLVSLATGSPMDAGLYEQSIHAMRQLLVTQDQPPVWSRLGMAQSRAGHYHNALDSFEFGLGMAYELGPLLDHATALRGAGQCDEALALRSSARFGSLAESRLASVYVGRIDDALLCGHPELAWDHGMEALAHDPESAAVHAALADVHRVLGEQDDADWYLMLAQQLDPRDPRVVISTLRALIAERRWPELARILPRLDGAIERDPVVFIARVQLAFAQGRIRDLAQVCQDGVWQRHEDPRVQVLRTSALEWLGTKTPLGAVDASGVPSPRN